MRKPDTKALREMEKQMAIAFSRKGMELAEGGWKREPSAHGEQHDAVVKACFHGQLHALLAGAEGRASKAFHKIYPN